MKKSTMYFAFSMAALILIGLGYVWMDRPDLVQSDNKTPKQGSDQKTEQLYQVPKSDLKSKHFVQDITPNKVGDYTVTSQGVQVKLKQKVQLNQTISSGPVIYHINEIRVLDNYARTDNAKRAARRAMDYPKLPKHYTTVEVHYQLTNHAQQKLITDGMATLSYPKGDVMTSLGGMVNGAQLANEGVEPGTAQSGYVVAYVPKRDAKHLTAINLEFASTYNESGQQISEKTKKIKVNL
ncbi:hypothetical protein JOC36_000655 [Weissella uvarum]|uniref:hypothetical protein n=1 Tax=Weissella uvarum TaxID=1479233 RepID=UPI0019605FFA|nr:hypothetical protein [Weissella uvarum]MBM7617106.1 hypothetical protein [Weissella uvarum]MCM0595402.1 hypothetical protein [Weissella uvarum]